MLAAAITAPLIGMGALLAVYLLLGFRGLETGGTTAAESAWVATQMIWGVWFILAPVAYVIEAVVMLAGWLLLRRRLAHGRPGLRPVTAMTVAAAIVAMVIAWAVFSSIKTPVELAQAVGSGVLAGVAAGSWFWFVAWGGAGPERPHRP